MLKGVMPYTQLLASLSTLRGNHTGPQSNESTIEGGTNKNAASVPPSSETDKTNALKESNKTNRDEANAERANTDSDIASSRSESPVPQPMTDDTPVSQQVPPTTPDTRSPIKVTSDEEHKEMTDEQKYQAKVLILDLLGWGVPPDYMLQRGISHELIHTVFSELRLRLPENITSDNAAITKVP